ncbi:MAG: hypothetical protein K9L68_00805 [Spirochaetales bacterium]|nr:hypothetical protein [Spirochaetales bacterium]MCF7937114.1 hypothetical protein [Spirochaetales bacterium]
MRFFNVIQDALDQGIEASRLFVDKAKERTLVLGDRGVVRMEIMQLRHEVQKMLSDLGAQVYRVSNSGEDLSITLEHEELAKRIKALREKVKEIDERVARLW